MFDIIWWTVTTQYNNLENDTFLVAITGVLLRSFFGSLATKVCPYPMVPALLITKPHTSNVEAYLDHLSNLVS